MSNSGTFTAGTVARALRHPVAPGWLVSCALVGCAYQPGSFANAPKDFAGQRVTIGCLDLSIERRADLQIGPVISYRFANRCDHPAMIDLGAVAVVGRNPQGTDVTLRPYDPKGELAPAALDGRNVGGEALAYPADRAMLEVCVDAASLARDAAPRWLCFGSPPETASLRAADLRTGAAGSMPASRSTEGGNQRFPSSEGLAGGMP